MSQTGEVTLFSTTEVLCPVDFIMNVLVRVVEADEVFWARKRVLPAKQIAVVNERNEVIEEEDYNYIDLGFHLDCDKVAGQYEPATCLHIEPLGRYFPLWRDAIVKELTPAVCGSFHAAAVIFKVGYHDIYEYRYDDPTRFVGTAFWSFTLWAYNSPADWDAYRKNVFRVPIMVEIRRKLAELGQCQVHELAHWCV